MEVTSSSNFAHPLARDTSVDVVCGVKAVYPSPFSILVPAVQAVVLVWCKSKYVYADCHTSFSAQIRATKRCSNGNFIERCFPFIYKEPVPSVIVLT